MRVSLFELSRTVQGEVAVVFLMGGCVAVWLVVLAAIVQQAQASK